MKLYITLSTIWDSALGLVRYVWERDICGMCLGCNTIPSVLENVVATVCSIWAIHQVFALLIKAL